jgi:hypothetical protein
MPRGCRRHTSWPVLERAWRLRHHQLDPNEREPRQILLPLLNTPDGVGENPDKPAWTLLDRNGRRLARGNEPPTLVAP